jgi:hypothetical protein
MHAISIYENQIETFSRVKCGQALLIYLNSIFCKERHWYFSRNLDGPMGAVQLTEKATVTILGISNTRKSPLFQPDHINGTTLHNRTTNTGS